MINQLPKNMDAACTPDFYLFNSQLHLYYRGRYDKSRPNNSDELSGYDLENAVNSMLEKKTI